MDVTDTVLWHNMGTLVRLLLLLKTALSDEILIHAKTSVSNQAPV